MVVQKLPTKLEKTSGFGANSQQGSRDSGPPGDSQSLSIHGGFMNRFVVRGSVFNGLVVESNGSNVLCESYIFYSVDKLRGAWLLQ